MPRREAASRPDGTGTTPPPASGVTQPIVPPPAPTIRELTRVECEAVLRRQRVGRIAFAFERRVEILPIHYVYDDGWLYGRTSPGTKIDMWLHSHWVAFEVDEERALFDWTSVIAHGGLYLLQPDVRPMDVNALEHALNVLRRLAPDTDGLYDPVPHRTIVFRIHVDEMTGRSARPPSPA